MTTLVFQVNKKLSNRFNTKKCLNIETRNFSIDKKNSMKKRKNDIWFVNFHCFSIQTKHNESPNHY
jgi:hypothetical protein